MAANKIDKSYKAKYTGPASFDFERGEVLSESRRAVKPNQVLSSRHAGQLTADIESDVARLGASIPARMQGMRLAGPAVDAVDKGMAELQVETIAKLFARYREREASKDAEIERLTSELIVEKSKRMQYEQKLVEMEASPAQPLDSRILEEIREAIATSSKISALEVDKSHISEHLAQKEEELRKVRLSLCQAQEEGLEKDAGLRFLDDGITARTLGQYTINSPVHEDAERMDAIRQVVEAPTADMSQRDRFVLHLRNFKWLLDHAVISREKFAALLLQYQALKDYYDAYIERVASHVEMLAEFGMVEGGEGT